MQSEAIYVFAQWQVKKDQLDAVLNLLSQAVKESRAEEGNLFYNIHQSKDDKYKLVLSEAYKNQEALDTHRNSAHFQTVVVHQIVPLLEAREVTVTSQLNFE